MGVHPFSPVPTRKLTLLEREIEQIKGEFILGLTKIHIVRDALMQSNGETLLSLFSIFFTTSPSISHCQRRLVSLPNIINHIASHYLMIVSLDWFLVFVTLKESNYDLFDAKGCSVLRRMRRLCVIDLEFVAFGKGGTHRE